ncbi:MAG TPA: GvpL/GvpF family gas vesicle protein [Pyrinomonadaceae bacterium]|nr:GvpL/GvpF family gas vesicle protein [Pyrinomonadaceae bacterium]
MSEQRPTRRKTAVGRGPHEGPTAALYVYCVGFSDSLAPLVGEGGPGAIEDAAPLELVGEGGLAAVVSAVPLADYGEEGLKARLADAAWTATRALRHERAVEHFARRAAVVPLRFGTIYLKRESVARMLAERAASLRAALARVEGREEWGVNLYVSRAVLRGEVERVSPRLRELAERAAASAPGQAYLLRKKIEAARDEETRAETRRAAAEAERRLRAVSEAAARLRVLKDEAAGQGEVAARLAFLVPRARFEEFRAAAEAVAADYAPLGFRLELTGPWPAYNFVAPGDEERLGVRG